MNLNELNQIVKECNTYEMKVQIDGRKDPVCFSLRPLSIATRAAMAERISKAVVTDEGVYTPELKNVIYIYYVLTDCVKVEFKDEFNATNYENMNNYLMSPIGQHILENKERIPFLIELYNDIENRINYRYQLYCTREDTLDKLINSITKTVNSFEKLLSDKKVKRSIGKLSPILDKFKDLNKDEIIKTLGDMTNKRLSNE